MSEAYEKSRTQIFYEWLSKNQIGFTFTIDEVLPVFKMSRPSMIMVLDRFTSVGVLNVDGLRYKYVKKYTGKFLPAKKAQAAKPTPEPAPITLQYANTPVDDETPKKSPLDALNEYVRSLEDEVKQLRALLVKKYS